MVWKLDKILVVLSSPSTLMNWVRILLATKIFLQKDKNNQKEAKGHPSFKSRSLVSWKRTKIIFKSDESKIEKARQLKTKKLAVERSKGTSSDLRCWVWIQAGFWFSLKKWHSSRSPVRNRCQRCRLLILFLVLLPQELVQNEYTKALHWGFLKKPQARVKPCIFFVFIHFLSHMQRLKPLGYCTS